MTTVLLIILVVAAGIVGWELKGLMVERNGGVVRNLEYARLSNVAEDGSPVLECLCDCGLTTYVTLAGMSMETGGQQAELAYTCHCGSSHWLMVGVGTEADHG